MMIGEIVMRNRAEIARFIELQLDWKTPVDKIRENKAHYGGFELKELMDFIFEGEPKNESEMIITKDKGFK